MPEVMRALVEAAVTGVRLESERTLFVPTPT